MTTITEAARRARIRTALEAPHDGTHRLTWRGDQRDFPVIRLNLDGVLLNPRSHRIRAQLESHPKKKLIEQDPWSDAAQTLIAETLERTEGFGELEANLAGVAQRDPGVITSAGVLVNANRRAVALRRLHVEYIRVAVLPEGAEQREIDRLELDLQMARDFKQEYTFTNQLLFIQDLFDVHGRSASEIAIDLQWATSRTDPAITAKCNQVLEKQQLLSLIRDVQTLSGGRIPLTDFDNHEQALSEINQEYNRRIREDPEKALAVRNTRLVAMLVGLGYRELRLIGPDFVSTRLLPFLQEDEVLGPHAEAIVGATAASQDVLPGLDLPGLQGGEVAGMAPMLAALATSHGNPDHITLPGGTAPRLELSRAVVVNALHAALLRATEEVRAERKAGTKVKLPTSLLTEVANRLRQVAEVLPQVREDPAFDSPAFEASVATYRRAADGLARLLRAAGPPASES